MEETKKTKRGGKRIGAGRPKKSDSKVQIALKLDFDLNEAFNSPQFIETNMLRGQYINQSIREKMQKDGILPSDAE